ncbi:MAG: acyl-CoA/acyl-ACP dehydrogenase [Thermomicrobiales bacterium]|nr:acyl-CoA/acyl-ACP dehydrogenase [Thermomicrobiales bacterium]
MDDVLTGPQSYPELRASVRRLCEDFPDDYWRACDRDRRYPAEFVATMTESRLLAALIPVGFGGLGLSLLEASIILEEVNRSGGNAAACHAQMYIMGALLRHGSAEQHARWLPAIARGELRLQAFSVTEDEAGSDTTAIKTEAIRDVDDYVVNGHKSWTSRVEESDLLLLLARTQPDTATNRRGEGLSLFLVDLADARRQGGIEIAPVRTMLNYATYQVTYRNLRVPAENLIGAEGQGFRHALDGMNAERVLLAAEAIGDGYWFVERASLYAKKRQVFGRPIGANQGIQFPIARAYAAVRAADEMRTVAARLAAANQPFGAEAGMAKLRASEASWQAANACLDTHGGYGFVDAYDVERKFRETRLYQVAPVSNNLVLSHLAQHVLGLPRSY